MRGNNLVCPYHEWAFDTEGNNKHIPYCNKGEHAMVRLVLAHFNSRVRARDTGRGSGVGCGARHRGRIGVQPTPSICG
eukprot:SAG11_NODE_11037_length_788_cov_1.431060_1_plen_77_part_10